MKIAIIGAGAIGSVVAGCLKKNGVKTLLVGRKEHVEAIAAKGLQLTGPEGREVIQLDVATRLTQEHDLVIFTTKTQDLERAYQDNCDHLENCFVLTTQNGVQGSNVLSSHFDRDKMIASIVMFGATYTEPGCVTLNFPGDWIIGKPYAANDETVDRIKALLSKAFPVVVTDNIMGMKWLKVFVNFNNCIPALTGKSMQETFADMDLCRLSIRLLKEGFSVVSQAGIELVSLPHFPSERIHGLVNMPEEQAAAILHQTLTTLSKEPLYGSILQSILRGKSSEIDFINGEIDQVATSIQTQAPLNRKVVTMVHQVEREGTFFSSDQIKKDFAIN